jgi:hypothetical protein
MFLSILFNSYLFVSTVKLICGCSESLVLKNAPFFFQKNKKGIPEVRPVAFL